MKRKKIIAAVIACLALLVVWWCTMPPQVEVHGALSQQDITDLIRLSHAERQRDLIDWSAPPPQWSIRQVTYRWKRFKFESARPIRIDQKPDHQAEVTIGTASAMRRYQFENTEHGWKHVTPKLE